MTREDLLPRPLARPWLGPPQSAPLADDHAVDLRGDSLVGRRVALLICGGIAAFKAPLTIRALRRQGADVTAFASPQSLRYVTEDALEWASLKPVVTRLSAQAEHLSGASPFDAYLLAPATYNSINKLAAGIADTVLTSTLASALGRLDRGEAAVLVAPTMHGSMHNRILMASLERLQALGVRVVPPRDAYGKDNIPDESVLVAEVAAALPDAPLKGRRVVVVGGADGVGQALAVDLIHRGARVLHLQVGSGAAASPVSEPFVVADVAEARGKLMAAQGPWDAILDATGGALGEAATMVVSAEGTGGALDGGPALDFSTLAVAVRESLG
jgi:3-polyprenyl-4-hydroxybenzoate decarboxylase